MWTTSTPSASIWDTVTGGAVFVLAIGLLLFLGRKLRRLAESKGREERNYIFLLAATFLVPMIIGGGLRAFVEGGIGKEHTPMGWSIVLVTLFVIMVGVSGPFIILSYLPDAPRDDRGNRRSADDRSDNEESAQPTKDYRTTRPRNEDDRHTIE